MGSTYRGRMNDDVSFYDEPSKIGILCNQQVSTTSYSQSNIPISLNIAQRRRENERIERENHAFAKRLFSNTGSIKKREFDQHYNEHIKHKIRIQKIKTVQNEKNNQLPPLQMSNEDSDRVLKIAEVYEPNNNYDIRRQF